MARQRLGELAVERGFITPEELQDALRRQDDLMQEGTDTPLGEILIEKGHIRRTHLEALLKAQKEAGRKRIGSYELLARLGEGGMGAVYKARDERTGGLVALKILPRKLAQDAEFVGRFEREGRLGLKLDHPNVALTLEVGVGEGPGGARYHYMAIEYVDGPDLDRILKERTRLPEREALQIALAVARALEHAQLHQMVHRDIKPSNILLARDGRVLLTDLGLARSTVEGATRFTLAGAALGTPHYISPEQARGEQDIDIRSDMYSLGATLYRMLTGKVPFEGGTAAVVVAKHLTEDLPNPRDIVPELSEGASRLVERMMAKKREDRHADPGALIADIERVLAGDTPTITLQLGLSSVRPAETVLAKPAGPETHAEARRRADTIPTEPVAPRRRGKLVMLLGLVAGCAAVVVGALAAFLPGGAGAPPPDTPEAGPAELSASELAEGVPRAGETPAAGEIRIAAAPAAHQGPPGDEPPGAPEPGSPPAEVEAPASVERPAAGPADIHEPTPAVERAAEPAPEAPSDTEPVRPAPAETRLGAPPGHEENAAAPEEAGTETPDDAAGRAKTEEEPLASGRVYRSFLEEFRGLLKRRAYDGAVKLAEGFPDERGEEHASDARLLKDYLARALENAKAAAGREVRVGGVKGKLVKIEGEGLTLRTPWGDITQPSSELKTEELVALAEFELPSRPRAEAPGGQGPPPGRLAARGLFYYAEGDLRRAEKQARDAAGPLADRVKWLIALARAPVEEEPAPSPGPAPERPEDAKPAREPDRPERRPAPEAKRVEPASEKRTLVKRYDFESAKGWNLTAGVRVSSGQRERGFVIEAAPGEQARIEIALGEIPFRGTLRFSFLAWVKRDRDVFFAPAGWYTCRTSARRLAAGGGWTRLEVAPSDCGLHDPAANQESPLADGLPLTRVQITAPGTERLWIDDLEIWEAARKPVKLFEAPAFSKEEGWSVFKWLSAAYGVGMTKAVQALQARGDESKRAATDRIDLQVGPETRLHAEFKVVGAEEATLEFHSGDRKYSRLLEAQPEVWDAVDLALSALGLPRGTHAGKLSVAVAPGGDVYVRHLVVYDGLPGSFSGRIIDAGE